MNDLIRIAMTLLPLANANLENLATADKDCGIAGIARDNAGHELRVDDFGSVTLCEHGKTVVRWALSDLR